MKKKKPLKITAQLLNLDDDLYISRKNPGNKKKKHILLKNSFDDREELAVPRGLVIRH